MPSSGRTAILAGLGLLLCGGWMPAPAETVIQVHNPTGQDWPEAPVAVPWTPEMENGWNVGRQVLGDDRPVDFQRDDLNGDGKVDELALLVGLKAGQTRELKFSPGDYRPPAPRAAALMSLKGFDGPAWESDLTAYRIYWNADNAMDIFGKTRPRLSLAGWATPGVPHNVENEYGLDVLKVGRSIGIGGFGAWIDGRIHKVSNVMKTHHIRVDGPIRAVVDLEYVHWQPGPFPDLSREPITSPGAPHYDLQVRMTIWAGQRWGEADITVRPHADSPMPEMVTGLPRHKDTTLIRDPAAGILGRWGRQALGDQGAPGAGDLGLGVVVDPGQVTDFGEDDFNTYVRLRPRDGRVVYRYHGSWFKEPGAAPSAAAYEAMLRSVAALRPEVQVR